MKNKTNWQRPNMKLRTKKRKNHISHYFLNRVRKENILSSFKKEFSMDEMANQMGLK